jgi:hypothetical protein
MILAVCQRKTSKVFRNDFAAKLADNTGNFDLEGAM